MKTRYHCQCDECRKHGFGSVAQEHRLFIRWFYSIDERCRRQFAGFLAKQYGYGGISHVSRTTGLSRTTILRGAEELEHLELEDEDRIRRPGAGRKQIEKKDPRLY